jgi:hypothetical protein
LGFKSDDRFDIPGCRAGQFHKAREDGLCRQANVELGVFGNLESGTEILHYRFDLCISRGIGRGIHDEVRSLQGDQLQSPGRHTS